MSDTPSSRATSATRLSLSHLTAQNETNLLGTVHGGVITASMDRRRLREASSDGASE